MCVREGADWYNANGRESPPKEEVNAPLRSRNEQLRNYYLKREMESVCVRERERKRANSRHDSVI